MSRRKYVFVQPASQSLYIDTVLTQIKFYQICIFPNPINNLFEIREIIIGGQNEIVSYKDLKLEKKNKKKLLQLLKENQYKLYSTYSTKHIGAPTCSDISVARSDMINTDNKYTGYAAFA